jgi:GDP-mannose transporter
MSRPQTPHGISPRGSYVNLLEGRENEAAAFSPSKIEKERLRAEAEVNASLLKERDGDKKKEEAPVVVSSPGTSLSEQRGASTG